MLSRVKLDVVGLPQQVFHDIEIVGFQGQVKGRVAWKEERVVVDAAVDEIGLFPKHAVDQYAELLKAHVSRANRAEDVKVRERTRPCRLPNVLLNVLRDLCRLGHFVRQALE